MNREELQQKVNVARDIFKQRFDDSVRHTNQTIERWMKDLGIDDAKVNVRNSNECFEVCVPRSDSEKYYHRFDITFRKNWNEEERKLELNVGTFGSFSPKDLQECRYYVIVGKLVEHIAEIERELRDFDWKKYDEIQREFYDANYQLEEFDREQKKIADDNKKSEFRRMIRIGVKVNCGKRNRWSETDEIKTIESVTAKNVVFAEDYGHRTKIDDLLRRLVNDDWKFVA